MGRTRKSTREVDSVIGYVRVSTAEQADSGAGIAAQRAAIVDYCTRRGLTLAAVYEDAGFSAKTLDRPALTKALAELDGGRAAGIVVAKVDRLSRSVLDFAGLLDRATRAGWKIAALDLGV